MTPTIGSIVANRFKLVRELGRGSMGSVWLADHLTLQVRCAVKFMTSDSQADPNFRTRFEFEARAIAQLHSPHVVRILDYAVADDVPFIAMEYLQGEDLCARLSRVGHLDATMTYRIVSQVARGLAKAHLAGLVHRDIKPENIFIAQEDDDEEVVKLLDFGVAKSAAFSLQGTGTQAGSLVGTPAYMSPEQARGTREIDHRSDLWSLAVITYQCLTGQLPFESPTLGDLFGQIMYEAIPVPSKVAPWLTPEFDIWWARAASRNADDRFPSARELAEALGDALAIPGVASDTRETWRARRPPESSTPPVVTSQPPLARLRGRKPAHLTTTQAPFTQSLLGARQLMRSRYVVAVLGSMAIMVVIGFFNPRAGAPATGNAAVNPSSVSSGPGPPSASGASLKPAIAPAASAADSSRRQFDATPVESTTSVSDLPLAPPEWSQRPGSVPRSSGPTRVPVHKTNRPEQGPKPSAPGEVDFGI